jgi:peptidoglycan/LPS O-acetylase OafA/YrhL
MIDLLTPLRGFLAVAIVWGHLQAVPLNVWGFDIYIFFSFPGRIMVWLFFVLSGYSIYAGYQNNKYHLNVKDTGRFYFNRIIRIIPLFYLTTILTWIVKMYISPEVIPKFMEILKTIIFFDFNLKNGIYEFTPTWFIGILVYFYLIAPILVKIYSLCKERLNNRELVFLLLFLSVFGHFIGSIFAGSNDIRNFVGCLPLFIFGFFAYDLGKEQTEHDKSIFYRIADNCLIYIILIMATVFSFIIYRSGAFWILPMEGYVGFLGVLLISTLKRVETTINVKSVNFFLKIILYTFNSLGKKSYGIYLWHSLVVSLLFITGFVFKGPPFTNIFHLLAAFIITVSVSYILSCIFFYLVEKPYHNLYKGS